jgi:hypothetical protein
MKFVVKECLSIGFAHFRRGCGHLDGVLFGKLLFDFFRERFGEDSSRAGRPEAVPQVRSGATSAIYRAKSQRSLPIALVNNSKRVVCNARPASTPKRLPRPHQWIAHFRCGRSLLRPVPAFNAA